MFHGNGPTFGRTNPVLGLSVLAEYVCVWRGASWKKFKIWIGRGVHERLAVLYIPDRKSNDDLALAADLR